MAGQNTNFLGYRMAFGGATYQTTASTALALNQWYVLIAAVASVEGNCVSIGGTSLKRDRESGEGRLHLYAI